MTENRNSSSTADVVVALDKEPAGRRPNTQHREPAIGHGIADDPLSGVWRQTELASHWRALGDDIGVGRRRVAQRLEEHVRVAGFAAGRVRRCDAPDVNELVRRGNRQRAPERGVHQREHRRVQSDAKDQRSRDRQREQRRANEAANRGSEVFRGLVEPPDAPGIATFLDDCRRRAERQPRTAACLSGRESVDSSFSVSCS